MTTRPCKHILQLMALSMMTPNPINFNEWPPCEVCKYAPECKRVVDMKVIAHYNVKNKGQLMAVANEHFGKENIMADHSGTCSKCGKLSDKLILFPDGSRECNNCITELELTQAMIMLHKKDVYNQGFRDGEAHARKESNV